MSTRTYLSRPPDIYVRVAEMKTFIQKIQEYERGGKDSNKVFVDQTLEYLKFFDQVCERNNHTA